MQLAQLHANISMVHAQCHYSKAPSTSETHCTCAHHFVADSWLLDMAGSGCMDNYVYVFSNILHFY